MSSFPILDLVIGMIFIFFLLSIICSSGVELWFSIRRTRARLLEQWLKEIFNKQAVDSRGRPVVDSNNVPVTAGRANYKSISDSLRENFVKNPTLPGGKNVKVCTDEQLKYAAFSAGWFWNSRKLNAIADQIDTERPIDEGANLKRFKEITKKTNGGYNGLQDRLNRFEIGVKFFSSLHLAHHILSWKMYTF